MRTTSLITKLSVVGALSLFAACGVKLGSVGPEQTQSASNTEKGANQEKMTVSASLVPKQAAGLNLADEGLALDSASDFAINVRGCASGFETDPALNSATSSVEMYLGDTDCFASLSSFTFNGLNYLPVSGSPGITSASGWIANQVITFEEIGGSQLAIQVVSQLRSPLANDGEEKMKFSFSETTQGADEIVQSTEVSQAATIAVSGQTAPFFQIAAHAYKGLTAGGIPKFTFKLECKEDVVYSSATPTATTCRGQSMSRLKYALVTNPALAGGDPSAAQLAALATDWSSALSIDNTNETIADIGALGMDNGGVDITGVVTASVPAGIAGENKIHTNPKLVLAVRYDDGSGAYSYTYFKVNITKIASSNH